MVLVDSNVIATRNKPKKREVRLRRKSDTQSLVEDIDGFSTDFFKSYNINTPINEIWRVFKEIIPTLLNKHVPKSQH